MHKNETFWTLSSHIPLSSMRWHGALLIGAPQLSHLLQLLLSFNSAPHHKTLWLDTACSSSIIWKCGPETKGPATQHTSCFRANWKSRKGQCKLQRGQKQTKTTLQRRCNPRALHNSEQLQLLKQKLKEAHFWEAEWTAALTTHYEDWLLPFLCQLTRLNFVAHNQTGVAAALMLQRHV